MFDYYVPIHIFKANTIYFTETDIISSSVENSRGMISHLGAAFQAAICGTGAWHGAVGYNCVFSAIIPSHP